MFELEQSDDETWCVYTDHDNIYNNIWTVLTVFVEQTFFSHTGQFTWILTVQHVLKRKIRFLYKFRLDYLLWEAVSCWDNPAVWDDGSSTLMNSIVLQADLPRPTALSGIHTTDYTVCRKATPATVCRGRIRDRGCDGKNTFRYKMYVLTDPVLSFPYFVSKRRCLHSRKRDFSSQRDFLAKINKMSWPV